MVIYFPYSSSVRRLLFREMDLGPYQSARLGGTVLVAASSLLPNLIGTSIFVLFLSYNY